MTGTSELTYVELPVSCFENACPSPFLLACGSFYFVSFFWLPAARVRVLGDSPFSQLPHEHSTFMKSDKNIHNHSPAQ